METKICKKCGKELPLEEFSKSNTTKDGHLATCKKCRGAFKNTPDKIYCPVCGKEKDYWFFKTASSSPTGRQWACSECIEQKPIGMSDISYRRKYDMNYRDKIKEQKRESFLRNIEQTIWRRAKQRAKKCNLEFNIDPKDIIIPEYCPILEIPIECGTKDDYEYSPSLDRIDNSKGYVKGNVWIISKKANSMKNSATPEELNKFCKNIIRYSLNNIKKEDIEQEDKEPLG